MHECMHACMHADLSRVLGIHQQQWAAPAASSTTAATGVSSLFKLTAMHVRGAPLCLC